MIRINYDIVKNNIKTQLGSTSGGLFDFDNMANHIKYEQNSNGTVVISANEPVITKQYDVPAFDLMLSAYSTQLIGAFHTSGTFEDLSDVEYNDLSQSDILMYDGDEWSNTSLSASMEDYLYIPTIVERSTHPSGNNYPLYLDVSIGEVYAYTS